MKKYILVLNLLLSVILNADTSNTFNFDDKEKKIILLKKIFLESGLEYEDFNAQDKQFLLDFFQEKRKEIVCDLDLNKIVNNENEKGLCKACAKQKKEDTKSSFLKKIPIKITLFLGAICLIIFKFDLLKKYYKINKVVKKINKRLFQYKNKKYLFPKQYYIYPSKFNCKPYFKRFPKQYKVLKSIEDFHIMMQRLCLESDVLECKITNIKDMQAELKPSQKTKLRYLLELYRILEEEYGESKTINPKVFLNNQE